MAKTDISLENVEIVVDRIVAELRLLKKYNASFIQVTGPTTKHKIYIQRSKTLGRIDCSIDLPPDDPMREDLRSPNGSIKCHIVPSLENLERVLRMLGDATTGTHAPNKPPRPFGPVSAPKAPVHRPKPLVEPLPAVALEPMSEEGSLDDRLARVKERARLARVNRILENDPTGRITRAEAEAVEDGRIELEDIVHADPAAGDMTAAAEAGVELLEA